MFDHSKVFNLKERMYDSTVIGDYLLCPRLFEYKWVKLIKLVDLSPALLFGELFHRALLIWYTTHNLTDAMKVFDGLPKFTTDTSRTRERARWLMEGYIERWKDEPYTIRELEVQFHIAMPGGSLLGGQMDMIVDWAGLTYVKEHKTSKQLGLSFFRSFRPNFQIDTYCYACRELVGRCSGAIINGIQVCKTKRAYEREVSGRSQLELDDFPQNYELIINDLERDLKAGVFKKNLKQCGMFGECQYKELCIYGDDKLSGKFEVRK